MPSIKLPDSNPNKFLYLPREILENIACIHTYHCITGTLFTGHLPSPLFISAMASQQDNQDLLAQEVNRASPKDDFPLPYIDDLVDNTAQHKVFSFMDGFSGYNQIKMAPEDMDNYFCHTVGHLLL